MQELTFKSLPKSIQFYRKKSGLTQVQLAKLAGVGETVVFDLEHGKQTVQLDTLLKVLSVLNIEILLKGPLEEAYETS